MRRRGLRLPLRREPDPVLSADELDWLLGVARDRVEEHGRIMADRLVSESVIRSRLTGEEVMTKLLDAGARDPKMRPPYTEAMDDV